MLTRIRYVQIPGYDISFPAVTSLIEIYAEFGLIDTYIPKSEGRSQLGTKTHKVVSHIMKGGHITDEQWPKLGTEAQNGVLAALSWQKAVGFKPKAVEFLVYSLKHGIAGHPDVAGICRPWWLGIFDWKIGDINNIRVKLQVPTYGFCYLEQNPLRKLVGFRAIHLDTKNATYEELIIPFDEGEHYFNEFLRMKKEVGII